MQPTVSIIVPVYNREKLLERTIKSLLPQLSNRVELILVNDGSTDNSGQVCEEYAKNNPYIRVIHKPNGGVSTARNVGIKSAQGEYISFVDSDDEMEDGAYEKLLGVIDDCHPDMLDFGWKYISPWGETENLHKIPKGVLLDDEYIKQRIIPPAIRLTEDKGHDINPFCWSKLYKRELLITHDVFFDENRRQWEDKIFIFSYIKHVKNFYSIDECLYRYIGNPNSLSSTALPDSFRLSPINYSSYRKLFGDEYDFDNVALLSRWRQCFEEMIFRVIKEGCQDALMEELMEVLQHPVILEWYAKSEDANQKIRKAVLTGEKETTVALYKKQCKKLLKKKKRAAFWKRVKSYCSRLIKRK